MKFGLLLVTLFLSLASERAIADRADQFRSERQSRVCFYEHINFTGRSFCMNPGESVSNLVQYGWNDQISSISVEGRASVQVFEHVNMQGQSLTIESDVSDIRAFGNGWNDRVSSFMVKRRWGGGPGDGPGGGGRARACFYEDINFQGNSFCLRLGDHIDNLVPSGWNDKISSVYIEGRISVNAYEHVGFGGRSVVINNSISDIRILGNFWNDKISSLYLQR